MLGLNAQGLLFPKSLYNAFNARQRAEGELSEYEELSAYMNHGRRDQINASSVSDRDKERDHLREDLLAVVRLLGLGPPPPFMSTVGLSREDTERVSQKRAAFLDFLQAAQFHKTKKKKKRDALRQFAKSYTVNSKGNATFQDALKKAQKFFKERQPAT